MKLEKIIKNLKESENQRIYNIGLELQGTKEFIENIAKMEITEQREIVIIEGQIKDLKEKEGDFHHARMLEELLIKVYR